jgi:hypothetical protein
MRGKILALLTAALLAGPMANASTLVGDWTGEVTNVNPVYDGPQVLDVDFLSETRVGSLFDLTGELASTCINSPDPGCGTSGKFISFTGSIGPNDSLTLSAADGALFDGSFSVNQNSLSGIVFHPGTHFRGDFSLSRAPEMDPTSAAGGLALLVGGLLVLRGRKRHIVAG